MERKWRENKEMQRERRNGKRMRKWRERKWRERENGKIMRKCRDVGKWREEVKQREGEKMGRE